MVVIIAIIITHGHGVSSHRDPPSEQLLVHQENVTVLYLDLIDLFHAKDTKFIKMYFMP
jgi:hypothetical protein